MGLSRRFLNLIVDSGGVCGARSLSCMDLMRLGLFNTKPPLPLNRCTSESEGPQESTLSAGNPKNTMPMIQLPAPSINFRASVTDSKCYLNCLPLAGGNLLCTDQSGRAILYNIDTWTVLTMPCLHNPKFSPLSIFVPRTDDSDGGGILYIMDYFLKPEMGDAIRPSHQFEAFDFKPTLTSFTKFCEHKLLPPPPFVNSKCYISESKVHMISSYAVVGGGSQVCISVDRVGTYCLDTVTHTWTQIGDWTLPFVGKVEYVPELKLWFGICAKDMQLGAADLSTIDMDSQPQLVDTWKEFEAPQEWAEVQHPQLVNLGSGKFCIARFFSTLNVIPFSYPDFVDEEYFTVLTGTDVVSCVHDSNGTANAICSNTNDSNGKVELKMIKHNSRCHMPYGRGGTIEFVF